MKVIKVKNTKDIQLANTPDSNVVCVVGAKRISLKPSLIKHIKPKLFVKVGDEVKKGSKIYYDKQDKDLIFVSPVCGTIKEIIYGHKRSLDNIVIDVKESDDIEKQNPLSLSNASGDDVRKLMIEGGLWGNLKQYPFLNIPKTSQELPKSIYITLDDSFSLDSSLVLEKKQDEFKQGVEALNKLFSNVYISVNSKNDKTKKLAQNEITHLLKGDYPSNDAGVFLYKNKKDSSENNSCTMNIQDIIKLGYMVKTGEYLNTQIVSIGGVLVENPTHYKITEGSPLSSIMQDVKTDEEYRIVAGSVFSGREAKKDDYIGSNEYSVFILSEDLKQDIFPFVKFGFNKYTLSQVYLSFLLPKKKLQADASLFGEDRSCISCGICHDVCPVETFPQELMKNIVAGRRSEYLDLGLLDCVDCGLCTYVCPSKIGISDIIEEAKNNLYKELIV